MITPCINICRLEGDRCVGCGRTMQQIANWIYYTDEQRQQIVDEVFNNDKTHTGN